MIYKIHFGIEDYIEAGSDGFFYAGSKAEVMRELHSRESYYKGKHIDYDTEFEGETKVELKGQWPNYKYHETRPCNDAGFRQEGGVLDVRAVEVTWEQTPRTKAEWIDYLNKHGEHPDNG